MRLLIALIFIGLFTGCEKKPKTQIIEIDASKDSTLFIERRSHAFGVRLIVTGYVNQEALITLEQTVPNTTKEIPLTKGDNNCTEFLSNVYVNTIRIVYYHKNVSKGNLKLTVNF